MREGRKEEASKIKQTTQHTQHVYTRTKQCSVSDPRRLQSGMLTWPSQSPSASHTRDQAMCGRRGTEGTAEGGEGGGEVREGGEGGRGRNRGRDEGRGFVVDLLVVYIFVSVHMSHPMAARST